MFRITLVVLLSLCLSYGFSQKKTRIYKLNPPSESISISLFDKLILLDRRDFKGNLGIVQLGAFNSRAQVVAEPSLDIQLQEQLTKAISGEKKEGTLLLRLDKFCLAEVTGAMSEFGYFDFTAVLFAKVGEDSYQEIAAIDTCLVVGGIDVTKKILNKSSQIVNHFLLHNLNPVFDIKQGYSLADIERYPELLKQKIPLYQTETLKDGLYLDFQEFKEQTPSGGLMEINQEKPRTRFYQRNKKDKLKEIGAKWYYALVVNGSPYISCLGDFYPLYKDGTDYYFTGPSLETASASSILVSSMLFGVIGAAVASSPNSVDYIQKLDFRNGSFVKIERYK
ncbi:hypothetical protein [Sphingobacterium sp. LRF_L2]|uniref:hypothetical protein n=1 Tax=Sphingobacterium sp. LRF_L2 TaxID=3369421 RepID=UPI003F633532